MSFLLGFSLCSLDGVLREIRCLRRGSYLQGTKFFSPARHSCRKMWRLSIYEIMFDLLLTLVFFASLCAFRLRGGGNHTLSHILAATPSQRLQFCIYIPGHPYQSKSLEPYSPALLFMYRARWKHLHLSLTSRSPCSFCVLQQHQARPPAAVSCVPELKMYPMALNLPQHVMHCNHTIATYGRRKASTRRVGL